MSDSPSPETSGVGEAPFVDSGPSGGPPEALVLDIGGSVGAVILYADEACLGQEIDLTPAGSPRTHHLHTLIRRRRALDRELIAGVYAEVEAGDYTVWGLDGEPLGVVVVAGGQVTEFQGGRCGLAGSGGG
jgi:hypothetical protein